MPRFYFDILHGEKLLKDEEGTDFESLEAAEQAAVEAATEMGHFRLKSGEPRRVIIEISDERRHRLATLILSLEVHRATPEPGGS